MIVFPRGTYPDGNLDLYIYVLAPLYLLYVTYSSDLPSCELTFHRWSGMGTKRKWLIISSLRDAASFQDLLMALSISILNISFEMNCLKRRNYSNSFCFYRFCFLLCFITDACCVKALHSERDRANRDGDSASQPERAQKWPRPYLHTYLSLGQGFHRLPTV